MHGPANGMDEGKETKKKGRMGKGYTGRQKRFLWKRANSSGQGGEGFSTNRGGKVIEKKIRRRKKRHDTKEKTKNRLAAKPEKGGTGKKKAK